MLRSIKEIIGYTMLAKDGDIGRVSDFYLDDEKWSIRYMIAATGKWLPGKKVLISPAAFYGKPEWSKKEFPLVLTREMIKNSPDIDAEHPVSRQKELELNIYYNWPIYWHPLSIPPVPATLPQQVLEDERAKAAREGDSHLRSSREILNYGIKATDGDIGRVADIIVDDAEWKVRYLVVDTGGWLTGRKVLIAPEWVEKVSWAESRLHVDLTMQEVKDSPVYDPLEPVNRDYEQRLYDYYGRPKYW